MTVWVWITFLLVGIVVGYAISAITRREMQRQSQEWRKARVEMRRCEEELERIFRKQDKER